VSQTRPPFLEEAVQQYWERIYRVLFRLTGDPAEADDLALETFWRLWQKPPSDVANLGGWLYRVAMRLGLNSMRARWRRWQYEQHAGRRSLEETDTPLPESVAECAEERRLVRQVLRQLTERQAQLLILRHSGLSYQEIATALDIRAVSVGKLLERAEQDFFRLFLDATEGAGKLPAGE